jgi:Helix-turn-helix domain of resolvase
MDKIEQTAAEISALLNSKPTTPTIGEIAAIIAKSMPDIAGRAETDALFHHRAAWRALCEKYDAANKALGAGRGILALLSGLAEEERTRILKRANEGRVAAIKRGTKLGRKPKLDDHQQREAIKRLNAGESCRAIAKTYRVHHATIGPLAG